MSQPIALIIEDDEDLIDIFANALQMAEFQTETIQNGRQALDHLTVSQPNLVILDLHLPDVSGEDILHYIRSDERLVSTRVMLITADHLLAERLRSQADLVLVKPISVSQLRDLSLRLRPPDTLGDT